MCERHEFVCNHRRVHIPESCRGVEVVVGIDEAGRGPVLGSLVYCAAFWPKTEHDAISKLGFDERPCLCLCLCLCSSSDCCCCCCSLRRPSCVG